MTAGVRTESALDEQRGVAEEDARDSQRAAARALRDELLQLRESVIIEMEDVAVAEARVLSAQRRRAGVDEAEAALGEAKEALRRARDVFAARLGDLQNAGLVQYFDEAAKALQVFVREDEVLCERLRLAPTGQ